jgi:hypothetical protein
MLYVSSRKATADANTLLVQELEECKAESYNKNEPVMPRWAPADNAYEGWKVDPSTIYTPKDSTRAEIPGQPPPMPRCQLDELRAKGGRPQQGGWPIQGGRPQQGGWPQQGGRPQQGGWPQQGGRPQQGGWAQGGNRPQNYDSEDD